MTRNSWLLSTSLVLTACSADSIAFDEPNPWPNKVLLPEVTGPRLVITNSGSDTLSFIDATSYELLAEVPVGFLPVEPEGPHHVQPSDDGRFLFVGISNYVERAAAARGPHGTHGTGTTDGYLLKIDAHTGDELARTRVSKSPGDVRLDRNNNLIWQSHFDVASVIKAVQENRPRSEWDSMLIGTDPDSMQKKVEIRICSAGHGVGFSPDGATLYVVCWFSDELAIVDIASRSVQRLILGEDAGIPPAPRYQPYALAVSPADGRVFVSANGPGLKGLHVYDPTSRAIDVSRRILTAGAPLFGDFSLDGQRLFIVTQAPDRLLVIDPISSSVLDDRDLSSLGCVNAHVSKLSPDQARLFIVCEGDRVSTRGRLLVLSAATFEQLADVELGVYPDDVAFTDRPVSSQ